MTLVEEGESGVPNIIEKPARNGLIEITEMIACDAEISIA